MQNNCPICGKKIARPSKDNKKPVETLVLFPFCSERCKLIDLNKWLESEYVIYNPIEESENNKPDEPENMLK